ncbi:MAG TPA: hypothetical protein VFG50_15005 [Rhodothermales bacterium]|nr:hypothetical protein [Rhodothermales bacterium]
MSFLRQEIDFVNHVRDPQQADINVFVTTERTGSGGYTYTMTFTGQKVFRGVNNVLTYTSRQTDTYNEERSAVAELLKVGLVPYLIRTPLVDQLKVDFIGEKLEPVPVNDPWDSWVFDVEGGGSFRVEATQNSFSIRGSASADRVTEDWKFRSDLYGNYREENIQDDDDSVYTSISQNSGFSGTLVKSLTAHLSAGAYGDVFSNTYRNQAIGASLTPAIEYNLYPYSESSRREWVVVYRIGYSYVRYIETTIFEKTEDLLLKQSLGTSINIRQPWGYIHASLEGSSYLHDLSKNSVDLNSNVSFRLAKGLSLRFNGGVEIIHDQLYLPASDVSLEERLLQQRQLATTYELRGSIGLAYTFGSMYNNVVNTRL